MLKVKCLVLKNKGAATLPMVLLIGGLLAEMAIVIAFMAYFLAQSGFGVRLSDEALAAARAGIADAEMKIVRDNSFSSPSPYSLDVGKYSAQIIVCKNSKTVSNPCGTIEGMNNKFEITSLGTALTKKRRLQVIINIDPNTNEAYVESEKEIVVQ